MGRLIAEDDDTDDNNNSNSYWAVDNVKFVSDCLQLDASKRETTRQHGLTQ